MTNKLNYAVTSRALANLEATSGNPSSTSTIADFLAEAADDFSCNARETARILKAATKVVAPENLFDGNFPYEEAVTLLGRLKRATR